MIVPKRDVVQIPWREVIYLRGNYRLTDLARVVLMGHIGTEYRVTEGQIGLFVHRAMNAFQEFFRISCGLLVENQQARSTRPRES